jgi:hypothetical protein
MQHFRRFRTEADIERRLSRTRHRLTEIVAATEDSYPKNDWFEAP